MSMQATEVSQTGEPKKEASSDVHIASIALPLEKHRSSGAPAVQEFEKVIELLIWVSDFGLKMSAGSGDVS